MNKVIIFLIILFLNCAYYSVGRVDYLYGESVQNNKNKKDIEIKYGHSMFTDKYLAKEIIPDSVQKMPFKQKKEYLIKYKYHSIGGMTACGYNIIEKIEILDTSKIQMRTIDFKDYGGGYRRMIFDVKDTGTIPIKIKSKDNEITTDLIITQDSIIISNKSDIKYEKTRRWFIPWIWIVGLWPFWPKF